MLTLDCTVVAQALVRLLASHLITNAVKLERFFPRQYFITIDRAEIIPPKIRVTRRFGNKNT